MQCVGQSFAEQGQRLWQYVLHGLSALGIVELRQLWHPTMGQQLSIIMQRSRRGNLATQ